MKKIDIYDTTLRDGAQMQGISYTVEDKVKIVKKLDELGVDFIEGGYPGSNPKDKQFYEEMQKVKLKHSKLVAFGSVRRVGIKPEEDENLNQIINAGTDYVFVYAKGSSNQVKNILRTTLEEHLDMIKGSIEYLRKNKKEVFFALEHFFDGFIHDKEYALDAIKAAKCAGAKCITLADTNGGNIPKVIYDITKEVCKTFPNTQIGIHCHNDMELAVANSLAAVDAGATHIDCTINGMGERCGNANLCSIVPTLELKEGMKCLPKKEYLSKITSVSRYVSEVTNFAPSIGAAYVGVSAFAHKAGSHIDAVNKAVIAFEHIEPKLVGNQRAKLISELSGRSAILDRIKMFIPSIEKSDKRVQQILDKIKQLEGNGYKFEDAEGSVDLIIAKELGLYKSVFEVLDMKIIIDKNAAYEQSMSIATIKIKVGDKERLSSAEGVGPVNALDKALRKAVKKMYPELEKVKLIDFKYRILGTEQTTDAIGSVRIVSTDGKNVWSTVGVSSNVVEAGYIALVDSIEYMFMKSQIKQ